MDRRSTGIAVAWLLALGCGCPPPAVEAEPSTAGGEAPVTELSWDPMNPFVPPAFATLASPDDQRARYANVWVEQAPFLAGCHAGWEVFTVDVSLRTDPEGRVDEVRLQGNVPEQTAGCLRGLIGRWAFPPPHVDPPPAPAAEAGDDAGAEPASAHLTGVLRMRRTLQFDRTVAED
ncbi:MAG: hypothetical protein ACFCGT_26090 [Sandaracinaceae bacterium]